MRQLAPSSRDLTALRHEQKSSTPSKNARCSRKSSRTHSWCHGARRVMQSSNPSERSMVCADRPTCQARYSSRRGRFHRIHPQASRKHLFRLDARAQDWCISRQQWWGHRIPAFYDERAIFSLRKARQPLSQIRLDDAAALTQDEDVLDTGSHLHFGHSQPSAGPTRRHLLRHSIPQSDGYGSRHH